MSTYLPMVHAKENSIAQQGTVGGTPAKVKFSNGNLMPGDVLSIVTPISTTWNSGGGPDTNADGVIVNPGPPVVIEWGTFNPGTPKADPPNSPSPVNLPYPNAANYSFGVGCLVGSLDKGNSFFVIGTNFTMTFLGNGSASTAPTELYLFYWDINSLDNTGKIEFTVSLTRASNA